MLHTHSPATFISHFSFFFHPLSTTTTKHYSVYLLCVCFFRLYQSLILHFHSIVRLYDILCFFPWFCITTFFFNSIQFEHQLRTWNPVYAGNLYAICLHCHHLIQNISLTNNNNNELEREKKSPDPSCTHKAFLIVLFPRECGC